MKFFLINPNECVFKIVASYRRLWRQNQWHKPGRVPNKRQNVGTPKLFLFFLYQLFAKTACDELKCVILS